MTGADFDARAGCVVVTLIPCLESAAEKAVTASFAGSL